MLLLIVCIEVLRSNKLTLFNDVKEKHKCPSGSQFSSVRTVKHSDIGVHLVIGERNRERQVLHKERERERREKETVKMRQRRRAVWRWGRGGG